MLHLLVHQKPESTSPIYLIKYRIFCKTVDIEYEHGKYPFAFGLCPVYPNSVFDLNKHDRQM